MKNDDEAKKRTKKGEKGGRWRRKKKTKAWKGKKARPHQGSSLVTFQCVSWKPNGPSLAYRDCVWHAKEREVATGCGDTAEVVNMPWVRSEWHSGALFKKKIMWRPVHVLILQGLSRLYTPRIESNEKIIPFKTQKNTFSNGVHCVYYAVYSGDRGPGRM